MQHKVFCVHESIKTESATAVKRVLSSFQHSNSDEEEHLLLESPISDFEIQTYEIVPLLIPT